MFESTDSLFSVLIQEPDGLLVITVLQFGNAEKSRDTGGKMEVYN